MYRFETEDLCAITPLISSYKCRKISARGGSNTFMINGKTYHTLIIDAEFETQIDALGMAFYNAKKGLSIEEIGPSAKIEGCA